MKAKRAEDPTPSLALVRVEPPVREIPVEVVPEGDPGPRPRETEGKAGALPPALVPMVLAGVLLAAMEGIGRGAVVRREGAAKRGAS